MERLTRRGWILFMAMSLIWGIPYLFIRIAVTDITPAALVFFRTAIGAILLVPMARGQIRALLPRWPWLLLYTVVHIGIPWLLLSDAERHLTSSLSGLLVAAVPIVGAILALALGYERLTPRRTFGLLVGLLGVVAIVGANLGSAGLRPLLEMGIVIIGYAAAPLLISRKLQDLPRFGVVAASMAISTLLYLPAGIIDFPSRLPGPSILLSVAVLGVVCTALAFLLFFALIAEVGPVRSTVITYINPAVAALLGVLLLGEPFSFGMGLGFCLILMGSVLATERGPAASQAKRDTSIDPGGT